LWKLEENKTKPNNQGHESKWGTTREVEEKGDRGRENEG
jgi:hypothetical protein